MSDGNRVGRPGMTSGFTFKVIFSVFFNLVFFGGMPFFAGGHF